MTKRIVQSDLFPACKSRKITVGFDGGNVTSDAGVLLLRQADRRIGLTKELGEALVDERRQASCDHSQLQLLRQRIYGIAQGYEDLTDHETLRHDIALQTAVDRDETLASASTLCRLEQSMEREDALLMNMIMVEKFIESFSRAPEELILDFDATDDPVHGQQEGRFFHGYYDQYCFLPLYVFCGEQLLVSYLRPSNIDVARHAWAILSLLVKRLRQRWPKVRITLRSDSGFCRWRMLRWCDRHDVGYIVGLAKNDRLLAAAAAVVERAEERFVLTQKKQRVFGNVKYAAATWDRARRVIVRAEHGPMGANPRFVVTNLKGAARTLYEKTFCARGEMENRIKEQQLDLFSDRTSCRRWWSNQFRLLLSSFAYVLLQTIRRLGLKRSELARAQCGTIRLKLLKIGAVVTRNTRSIRFHLSSACPYQDIFRMVAQRLVPS